MTVTAPAPARPRRAAPLSLPRPRRPLRSRPLSGRAALAWVGALTLVALGIRLAVPQGLWLDEAISVHQAHLSLGALLQDLAQTDRHPPLFHLALWGTLRVLGDSDLAVRLPSIVAGTLTIPALYALGREVYDRRTGLVAALIGTISPILVWYAQEARMYAFVILFATLTALGCARALRRGGAADWTLYAVAAALLLWSHWFGGIVVLTAEAILLGGALRRRGGARRRTLLAWGGATLLLAASLVPLGLLAARQLAATGSAGGYAGAATAGTGISFYTVTANVSWLLAGFHPEHVTQLLSAVWPLGMLVSLLTLGRRLRGRTVLLAVAAAVPVVALLILGAVRPAVFDVRYFVAAAPLAIVLGARLAVAWSPSGRRRALIVGALLLLLGGALADQQLDPANPRRYEYRAALAHVQAELGPRDVLLYEPAELRYVLDRYAPHLPARPLEGTLPTPEQARHVVVLTSFGRQPRYRHVNDRQLGALRYARDQIGRARFPGVVLRTFGAGGGGS